MFLKAAVFRFLIIVSRRFCQVIRNNILFSHGKKTGGLLTFEGEGWGVLSLQEVFPSEFQSKRGA